MSNVESLINNRVSKESPDSPAVSISFRGSEDVAMELAALTKILGYSTRSKLLAQLVPAAINDAFLKLPEDMQQQFEKELAEIRALQALSNR